MALVEAYAEADGTPDKAQNAISLKNKLSPAKPKPKPKTAPEKAVASEPKIPAVSSPKSSPDKAKSPVTHA